jgi:hypothetical protein
MEKIGSHSLDRNELFDTNTQTTIKDHDLQIPAIDSSGGSIARTLKAVYPHFAQSRKRNAEDVQMDFTHHLSDEELKLAMEKVTKDLDGMRDIQKQLNRVYQELMTISS